MSSVSQPRCATCGRPESLSPEEANCLSFKAHGQLEVCPDCGTVGMLWHKLGCPRDSDRDHPAEPDCTWTGQSDHEGGRFDPPPREGAALLRYLDRKSKRET